MNTKCNTRLLKGICSLGVVIFATQTLQAFETYDVSTSCVHDETHGQVYVIGDEAVNLPGCPIELGHRPDHDNIKWLPEDGDDTLWREETTRTETAKTEVINIK